MVGLVALGMMNLALVFTAALVVFAEKTLPYSHRVARPLGVLMMTGGVVLLAFSLLGGMETGTEAKPGMEPGARENPGMEEMDPGMDSM
jgi:heme A synthase